jgi:hypothetical protein
MSTETRTTLESFSNELLIDLFEYFNAVDLLPAFVLLNRRFHSLMFHFCRTFRLDFRSIVEKDFDNFYNPYLLLIKNRTIYLRLSDDEETPCQCSRLLSINVTLDQFTNLRSFFFVFFWLQSLYLKQSRKKKRREIAQRLENGTARLMTGVLCLGGVLVSVC